MPAILLADVSGAAQAMALESIIRRQGGSMVRAAGSSTLALFGTAPSALSCALAILGSLAERNREGTGEKPVLARMSVHSSAASSADAVSDAEVNVASLILEAAPSGRIFVSRQIYTLAHGSWVCAFIPLGSELYSGVPEPVEMFDAVPAVGRPKTAPPSAESARRAAAVRATGVRAALPALESASPAGVFGAFPVALAAALGTGVALFAAQNAAAAMLAPFDLANYVAHIAGHMLIPAEEGVSQSPGAVFLQAVMPLAAFVYFWVRSYRLPALAALLWLGQNLLGVGVALSSPTETGTFAACVKADALVGLDFFGLLKHFKAVGQLFAFLGCLLVAGSVTAVVAPFLAGARE